MNSNQTDSERPERVPGAQQAAAWVALVAGALLVLLLLGFLFRSFPWLIVGLVGLALVGGGGWVAITERMPDGPWAWLWPGSARS